MWKSLLAGTAVLALAGTGFSLAQQGPSSSTPPAQTAPAQSAPAPAPQARTAPGTASDAQAYRDARIAALRAGLALSPEQEKAWPAFERAWREFMEERATARAEFRDRMRERRADRDSTDRDRTERDDPLDRLQRFADRASRRAAALKDLADATAPLVNGLDESQKRRFWSLARPFGSGYAGRDGFAGRDGYAGRDGRGPHGHHGWHHGGRPHDRFHDHGRHGFRGPDQWRDGGHGYGRGYDRYGYGRDGYGRDGYNRNDWRDDDWRRNDWRGWREGRRDDDRRGYGPSGSSRRSDDRRPLGPMEERL
ncbi:Spy/CpxP family protein refolding chaperone [Rhodoplanes sp. SY1]|uniref:Spy/CpxP family protein refolding chaperone n=1 Tax=Rhodoplanes sp. SY1 TaxID=3166646 RepID=UPI0038B508EB